MDAGTTEQVVGAAGAAVAEVATNPDALTTGIPWLDATVQSVAALYALATVLGLGKHFNAFFYLCAKLGMDVPGLVKFVAGVVKAFKARKLKVPPTAMIFLVCMTCSPAYVGCLPPSQGGGVDWPKVAKCAPDVGDVIGIVSRVLFGSGDVKAELAEVAQEHGAEAVTCAVKQLQNKFTAPGAASSPERTHASERAAAFLDDVGTQFAE